MKQKAVFFIRTYNAIDHTVPVMYKLIKTTNIEVVIILYGSKKYFNDYRIKYLNRDENVNVYHINDFSILQNLKIKRSNIKTTCKIIYLKMSSYFDIVKKRKYQKIIVNKLIDNIFKESETGIVAFDWQARSEDKVRFANMVIEAAKKREIAQICLPHGDSPDYNWMFKKETIDYESIDQWGKNPFDIVVVPNNLCAKRYIQLHESS